MGKYYFYYDESAHSRKMTTNTVNQVNFEPFFCTSIVGIQEEKIQLFENDYVEFEEKWKRMYSISGELKSTVIKHKKYEFGLNSFNKLDVEFFSDFFDLLVRNNILINIGIISKFEFLVRQIVDKIDECVNRNAIYYIVTKALSVYRPQNVIDRIINQEDEVLLSIKDFLHKRRDLNQGKYGETEEQAFSQVEEFLTSVSNKININWDYRISFIGFKKYLFERSINDYCLFLDREGNGNTINSAMDEEIINVKEVDSNECIGVRCSDILSSFIINMINSLDQNLNYEENEVRTGPKLLPEKWLDIKKQNVFDLYKKTYDAIIQLNASFYKISSLLYADGIIYLNAFLNYFPRYSTIDDFQQVGVKNHQNYINTNAIIDLWYYYHYLQNNIYFCDVEDINYQFLFDYDAKYYRDYLYYEYYEKSKKPSINTDYGYKNMFQNSKKMYNEYMSSALRTSISKNGSKINILIQDFFTKVDNCHLIRYFVLSIHGRDCLLICPPEIYKWFDEQNVRNQGGILYPRMITITNNDGFFDIIPFDPEVTNI